MSEKDQKSQETNEEVAEVSSSEQSEGVNDNPEVCFNYEEVDKMMAVIQEKNRLLEENTERLKRLQADFDNFRRRTRQEKEDLSSIVAQTLILELLPVLDNFERALSTASNQDAGGVLSGIEMIYRQFSRALEKNGLAAIEAVGSAFNPEQHEAVMRVEDSEKEDGTVVEELQKGYVVRGKVIRPSMVKVIAN